MEAPFPTSVRPPGGPRVRCGPRSWLLLMLAVPSLHDLASHHALGSSGWGPASLGAQQLPLEPGRPLGQPPIWVPRVGASAEIGVDGSRGHGEMAAGLRRDLLHPVMGLLGVRFEALLAHREEGMDPGVRTTLDSPVFFLQGGIRWTGAGGFAPHLGMTLPAARGGWPVRGGMLEIGWLLEGGHRFSLGLSAPAGASALGRTRPRASGVRLPAPRTGLTVPSESAGPSSLAGGEVIRSMAWISTLHNLYWLTDRRGISGHERVLRSGQILRMLALEAARRDAERGGPAGYPGEVLHYHARLTEWFSEAAGPLPQGELEPLVHRARWIMLDEVVLPYNGTVGQVREEDRLDGLLAEAAEHFRGHLARTRVGEDPVRVDALVRTFLDWGAGIDEVRADLGAWTRDTRVQWIPLALVLHPDEHAERASVDALLERALDRPFTHGNRIEYFDALRFHGELLRTIRETRVFHLLWIHDLRARRDDGETDLAGFQVVTEGYLTALVEAVRRHDRGEDLPLFLLLIDQYYYEENETRRWLDLLADPLHHRVRLPGNSGEPEARIAALQRELREAVDASERLAGLGVAGRAAFVRERLRVQVNVTNPADFSFRSRDLLAFPFGADNLMRDHRKIVARDLVPEAPWQGEVILTGKGVGEKYSDPAWEDRSILIRGPGALPALEEARWVLETHGIRGDDLPSVLRPHDPGAPSPGTEPPEPSGQLPSGQLPAGHRPSGPLPSAPASVPAGWRLTGAEASLLQVHNRTGLDRKEASFVQMLLYDLLPAGTVIYVPDSLWTSPEWMAQLVSAALRGCEVLVVAPALTHAPQPGFPSMAETRELLTALLLVRQELAGSLEAGGGRLEVGFYSRGTGTDDLRGRAREFREAASQQPRTAELFPVRFPPPVAGRTVTPPPPGEAGDTAEASAMAITGRTDPGQEVLPKLHSKAQLYVARELLDRVLASPGVGWILTELEAGGVTLEAATRAMHGIVREAGAPELHLVVGSVNRNVRSMALDGEAMALVTAEGAGVAVLDFLLLTGAVRWVEEPSGLDAFIPGYPDWKRLLGRWLIRIL
jgi:hypothetical protein